MEVHLHFGMHRDVKPIHDAVQDLNGLIVPAHILAYLAPSTSVFVTSITPRISYMVDPVTYRLQSPRDKHLKSDVKNELRPSTLKVVQEYHKDLAGILLGEAELTAAALPPPGELTEGVLRFQETAVANGSRQSAAKKYLERYAKMQIASPRVIVPPYFRFEYPGDSWYQYSLDCARIAAAEKGSLVAPVIFGPLRAFREATLTQIVKDYRDYESIILWIDDFHENQVRSKEIEIARRAIRRLSERGRRVESLYGGYLQVLSRHDGLLGIAHGILYTQHKSAEISAAGEGGAAERYYIPGIHQFRSLSQADHILHKHPELICDCHVCQEYMHGDPDRIVIYADNPELLRRHFLAARRAEADGVLGRALSREAERLREVHARYDASIQELPNPDAVVSGGSMPGLAFLLEWAAGIEANVD